MKGTEERGGMIKAHFASDPDTLTTGRAGGKPQKPVEQQQTYLA